MAESLTEDPPTHGDRIGILSRQSEVLAELQAIVGFQVSLAHNMIRRDFDRNCSELGLTQKQIAILWVVEHCPNTVQTDLVEMFQSDRSTISNLVRRLKSAGHVDFRDSRDDGRVVPLKITSAGASKLREAKKLIEAHEGRVAYHLAPADKDVLVRALGRIHRLRAS
ncbi:MarR family winged helix-turn-helix transcriptional regulator [Parasphingopyxis marina]|uniref:MarR family transcriptional regulator n=1 Tax=Parasphingopyxis marina TaxID=2761622 RepID=A0A842HXR5_9SPHN|nr:MarR family transcriptional regulator [Parasphingopyxis marina]MBC2778958.1 MarR family transcriptional regulator [Parasphingopyxis marina]